MTPFQKELEQNILATIQHLRKRKTINMGLENLRQIVPSPKTFDGAPRGSNMAHTYSEMFRDICKANTRIRKFVLW